jgi:hypothetical protein
MSFSLSQGPFTYNRFDEASKPDYLDFDKDKNKKESMKKALNDKKKMKKEEIENVEEVYAGKHGQTDKQYADSRSQGGKMISGDSKMSGAEYTHGRRVKAANPGMQPDVGGKTKPKSQGKMDNGTRADLQYRKANMNEGEMPDFIKKMKEKSDGACDCKEKKEGKSCGCGKKEKKEQFVDVVRELMAEGYDLSQFTWDGLYSLYESETLLTSSESDSVINKMVSSGLFSESEIALIQNSN